MVAQTEKPQTFGKNKLNEVLGLDLRSLAAFRIGVSLVLLTDLGIRFGDLVSHYTDAGVMPRSLLAEIAKPWHWSLHAISGLAGVQVLLFIIAAVMAIAMLVGYRTRIVTIVSWILLISLHNRNPALIFAADDVLRALMFWAMFLPWGAKYSIDNAFNTAQHQLPVRVVSGATFALMCQQCFIYIFSAAIKAKDPVWFNGDAVYYALNFDQYATPLGHLLLNFPPLLKLSTHITFVIEWFAPLLIFIPFRNSLFRMTAVIIFIMLHAGFGLTLNLGIFPFLSIFSWLAFLPSSFWDNWYKRLQTPERQGLKIYFDADCGFCKKVVHLLRTLLILPETPLLMAQDYPDIYADMQAYNSWVVEDWQGKRHFKFEGISYIISLSPVFWFLAPVLNWRPIMAVGTKFYEAIASNRKIAGRFTKPFKFRPQTIRPSKLLNIVTVLLLLYAFLWNISSYSPDTFKRKIWQQTAFIGRATRLDQSWSIFAPGPPKDDGWYVIPGRLQNGNEVDIFRHSSPVIWDKPSLEARGNTYGNMQWRTYFINLNRAMGKLLYPVYAQYLCQTWNHQHSQEQRLTSFDIYFMNERTVPPGQQQTVEKKQTWQQSCSN